MNCKFAQLKKKLKINKFLGESGPLNWITQTELNNENRKSIAVNPTIQVSELGNKKDITELTKVGWMLEGSRTSSGTKTSSTSELG
jgi:hypothetical protein